MERKNAVETFVRLQVDAVRVSAAGSYLAHPEGEAAGVGLAVEEIVVVLADEDFGVVDDVGCGLDDIVGDLDGGGRLQRPSAAPPVGFESATVKVSLPSTFESSLTSTSKVFDFSPAAKRRVPRAVV